MELTLWQLGIAGISLIVLGVVCGKLLLKKNSPEYEGFFSRVFRDNKDFDSTLDRVCISVIILFMLVSFHDDFGDAAKAGLLINLFLMAFNAWQSLVLNKTIKDMQNGGTYGSNPPPSADN